MRRSRAASSFTPPPHLHPSPPHHPILLLYACDVSSCQTFSSQLPHTSHHITSGCSWTFGDQRESVSGPRAPKSQSEETHDTDASHTHTPQGWTEKSFFQCCFSRRCSTSEGNKNTLSHIKTDPELRRVNGKTVQQEKKTSGEPKGVIEKKLLSKAERENYLPSCLFVRKSLPSSAGSP